MRGIQCSIAAVAISALVPAVASAQSIAYLPASAGSQAGKVWVNIDTPVGVYEVSAADAVPTSGMLPIAEAGFSGSFTGVAGGLVDADLASSNPFFGELTSSNPGQNDLSTSGWVDTGVAYDGSAAELVLYYAQLGDPASWSVAFEALPGDANFSRTVDIDDASILLTNFGATSGKTWAEGDFTGDGAVNIDDASALLGNFGASYSPAAGEIEVTIDIANKQVLIEANSVALIRLEDPSGNIISYDPAVAFSTVNPVTPTLVGEFMLGNFITGTAVIGFDEFVNQEVIIG
ncbi:MAG: hypothetical protein JJU36_16065, partial [Phycisphaeraceae bacterium]|nr:hypothetical protein [Phycisphaeraceae bacterium]